MREAWNALWTAFTTLFIAFDKSAKAINHLSGWAEETACAFEEEARLERIAKRKALEIANGVDIDGNNTKAVKKAA